MNCSIIYVKGSCLTFLLGGVPYVYIYIYAYMCKYIDVCTSMFSLCMYTRTLCVIMCDYQCMHECVMEIILLACCGSLQCCELLGQDRKIVMVGLDAAGKTTVLYKLKLSELLMTIPTIGSYGLTS